MSEKKNNLIYEGWQHQEKSKKGAITFTTSSLARLSTIQPPIGYVEAMRIILNKQT